MEYDAPRNSKNCVHASLICSNHSARSINTLPGSMPARVFLAPSTPPHPSPPPFKIAIMATKKGTSLPVASSPISASSTAPPPKLRIEVSREERERHKCRSRPLNACRIWQVSTRENHTFSREKVSRVYCNWHNTTRACARGRLMHMHLSPSYVWHERAGVRGPSTAV